MKSHRGVLMVFASIAGLAGCGGPTPTDNAVREQSAVTELNAVTDC